MIEKNQSFPNNLLITLFEIILVDEKKEDKSKKSLERHLIFYKKLNKKILDMENEIHSTSDEKILEHLKERIGAVNLDKTRIRKLFPDVDETVWNG